MQRTGTLFLITAGLVLLNVVLLVVRLPDDRLTGRRAAAAATRPLRVGLVFDVGGRGDKSFNDAAYAGVEQAVAQLGVEAEFVEPGEGSDRESGIRLLAARGFDLIIGVGFIFSDDMIGVARDYPGSRFACVDYAKFDEHGFVLPPSNMVALKFREEEGSYLVGALAGLLTKGHTVGFVGGMDIPLIHKFESGYRAGVLRVCPSCKLLVGYAGTSGDAFKNPAKGKELALAQYGAGADIIFHAAGSTGLGVFEAARERDRRAIGVDADQWSEAPGYLLTSMTKQVDVSVLSVVRAVKEGRFSGGVRVFGLKENGVDYVYDEPRRGMIPQNVRDRVEALRAEIIAGRIIVPERALMTALCELLQVSVRYGPLWANRAVSLRVDPGEIVALVGENGAGKSTLLHALYGTARLATGTVRYHGQPVVPSPERAIAAGIGLVHQHFMLVPPLTVAENVVLGSEPRRPLLGPLLRIYDRRRAEEQTAALGARYGLAVDPTRPVSELTVGEAQRVEILKVLYRGARLLVLDEPTAVLTPGEVDKLLAVLKNLLAPDKSQAKDKTGDGPRRGMLLVTHKLDEVMAIADRVVVMRRGEVVRELSRAESTPQVIARAMVGRDLVPVSRYTTAEATGRTLATAAAPAIVDALPTPAAPASAPRAAPPALEVAALSVDRDGARRVSGVSFSVRPGEILGIAGVEGNGQTELCAALFGLLPAAAGAVRLSGADITAASVSHRRRAGVALVPEDRHRFAMVLDFSLAENFLLGRDDDYAGPPGRRWLIDRQRLLTQSATLLRDYDVHPADPHALASSLSGGNQQKVVIARELSTAPRLILAAQPTRGVDIGAIEAIHRRLLAARDRGCAILLFSAELDELRALSDRIAVMYRGSIVAELENPMDAPLSRDRLGELMTGAADGSAGRSAPGAGGPRP